MGTIIGRTRKDCSRAFTAQIVIKKGGKIVHREAETFDCKVDKLLRKSLRGDLPLPIVRIETSQKAQRGVHLVDPAAYIDKQREAALKGCRRLTGQT
jgi:hypothetical protein